MKSLKVFTTVLATLSMTLWTPAALAGPRNADDLLPGSAARPRVPPTRRVVSPYRPATRSPMSGSVTEIADRGVGRAILDAPRPDRYFGVKVSGQLSTQRVMTDFDFYVPRSSNPVRQTDAHATYDEAVDAYMRSDVHDPFAINLKRIEGDHLHFEHINDITTRQGIQTRRGGEFYIDATNAGAGGRQPGTFVRTKATMTRTAPEGSVHLNVKRSTDGRSLEVNLGEAGSGSQKITDIELPENVGTAVDFEIDVVTSQEAGLLRSTRNPIVEVKVHTADERTLTYHYEVDPDMSVEAPEGGFMEVYGIRRSYGPSMGRWSNDVAHRLTVNFSNPVPVRQAETGVAPDGGVTGMGDLFGGSDGTN